jgi:hypothetical protein
MKRIQAPNNKTISGLGEMRDAAAPTFSMIARSGRALPSGPLPDLLAGCGLLRRYWASLNERDYSAKETND